jgi:DNA-binding MarR family transcriptional regulator
MTRTKDIERIVTAAHALTRIAAVRTGSEVPAAQWRMLSALNGEGALRVGALAQFARTPQPVVTRLVGQLVDEGLVTRAGDPEDSRATVVDLTADGRAALDRWRTDLVAAIEPLFTDLADDEWETLRRASQILADRTAVSLAVAR